MVSIEEYETVCRQLAKAKDTIDELELELEELRRKLDEQ